MTELQQLKRHTFRFIAGRKSLHELRDISRKRLYTSSVNNYFNDAPAKQLNNNIQAYSNAVNLLRSASDISLDILLRAHSILGMGDSDFGALRKEELIVGPTLKRPYIPPNPNDVEELLQQFTDILVEKRGALSRIDLAINLYVNLLNIHPFKDGNGRLARAVFDAFTWNDNVFNIALFRMLTHQRDTLEFYSQFPINSFDFHKTPYAEKFKIRFYENVSALCLKYSKEKKKFFQDFQFVNLTNSDVNFLDKLWACPVQGGSVIATIDGGVNSSVVDFLLENNKIEIQFDKKLGRPFIFCEESYRYWTSVDSAISKF